ncbi:MAG: S-methyl-5-thioribose-1-phosphate isomerase [Endomicrobiaceae bacterium]
MVKKIPETLFWKDNVLLLLNQLELPYKVKYKECKNYKDVINAIKVMIVRGAPAIGVAAAYGMLLAGIKSAGLSSSAKLVFMKKAANDLVSSRPTAVNLKWAVEKMMKVVEQSLKLNPENYISTLYEAATDIYDGDILTNIKMAEFGARLLKKDSVVITHCNAGALATAGYGTALGMIRTAYKDGKIKNVFVDETRPYLQGARLTAWELQQERIPYTLITDNMSGYIMKTEKVDAVIVGADRIAMNGDVANKIGTYSLSILAKYHKIPFYVVAPSSTVDFSTLYGVKIKIEERPADEILKINGKNIAPKDTRVRYPGFDITPASNITMIITEKGVYKPNKISILKKVK